MTWALIRLDSGSDVRKLLAAAIRPDSGTVGFSTYTKILCTGAMVVSLYGS